MFFLNFFSFFSDLRNFFRSHKKMKISKFSTTKNPKFPKISFKNENLSKIIDFLKDFQWKILENFHLENVFLKKYFFGSCWKTVFLLLFPPDFFCDLRSCILLNVVKSRNSRDHYLKRNNFDGVTPKLIVFFFFCRRWKELRSKSS